MHDVKYQSSGTGTMSLFDIEFKVNKEFIRIYAGELIRLIKKETLYRKTIIENPQLQCLFHF